jgi:MFS transporter, FSR family, fosmidomycin resistance protein
MTEPADVEERPRDAAGGALRLAVIYGVLHAVVDLCTVAAVYRAATHVGSELLSSFYLVVGYDVMAFALQSPLGLLVDRLRASRAALLVGLASVAAALICVPTSAVATMAAAGLGNALFHISAGAPVLAASRGRAAPAGIYVAPGALGLGLGMWVGGQGSWPIWPLGLLLAAGVIAAVVTRVSPALFDDPPSSAPRSARDRSVALGALLLSVAVRSFVGFGAPFKVPRGATLTRGLPLVGFGGKLVGGLVADRLGWLETSAAGLLLSAPLIAFGASSTWTVLLGLLLFQTTMPVTLTAVYLLLPSKPATAFGLPCLALIAGALPTFYPAGKELYGASTFLALILTSTVAVVVGLRLIGVRRGRVRTF